MLVAIWATVYSIGFKGIGKKTNYSAVFGSKKNYKKIWKVICMERNWI